MEQFALRLVIEKYARRPITSRRRSPACKRAAPIRRQLSELGRRGQNLPALDWPMGFRKFCEKFEGGIPPAACRVNS